jgi:hypothetical protein
MHIAMRVKVSLVGQRHGAKSEHSDYILTHGKNGDFNGIKHLHRCAPWHHRCSKAASRIWATFSKTTGEK